MFQDFDKMSVQSRVWVYQTDRQMTAKEENKIMYTLKASIEQWNAHGDPLQASAKISQGRFVIIALDESQKAASGCSIDASTHWLKQMGDELTLDFFDRSLSFEKDGKIQSIPVFSLKGAIEAGKIVADTIVFNNNVDTIGQLLSQWKVPAAKLPFLARYFQKQVA